MIAGHRTSLLDLAKRLMDVYTEALLGESL